jgi:hypothetical protein
MNTNGYSNLAPDLWIDVRKSSFAMENLKKDAKAGEYIKNAGFYSVSGNPKRVEEIFPKANSTIDWVFDASDKYWLCRLSNTKKLAIMNPSTGEIAITDAKPSNLSVEIFPMGHYCYLIQSAVYSEEAGYSREIWVFDSNVGSLKLALEAQTESADIELEDHDNDGFYETLVFPVDGPSGQNENETDIYTFKNNKFIESKK